MARPERNNIDYFPHEVNHGKKMFFIRQKYKNDGYAVWFIIIEELGKANNHYLNLSNQTEMMYLSAQCMVPEDVLKNIINDLSILGAINKQLWDEYLIIWSDKFINSIQDAYNKRRNECMSLEGLIVHLLGLGVLKRGFRLLNGGNNAVKGGNNPQRIEEDSIEEKKKEKDKPKIPSLNDFLIQSEIACKKAGVDFNELKFSFESKYETWVENGWKDGNGTKINKWKSKINNVLPFLKPIKETDESKRAKIRAELERQDELAAGQYGK